VSAAIRASGRYVFNSRALRAVLVRAAAFILFASALWALLPAIAHDQLGLGSGGYGLLLGCVGVGAVSGAFVLPLARGRLSPDALLALASLAVAAATAVLAQIAVVAVAAVALVVAGLGWILALATLNSTYQSLLPGWVKARALGFYLIVFQGGTAVGSAILGLLAARLGVTEVMTGAAAVLAVAPFAASRRWPIPPIAPEELLPAGDEPHAEHYEGGPVMVTIERRGGEPLVAAVLALRKVRRRTGATAWTCWHDVTDDTRVLEQFVVASWDDHQRQIERITVRDRARLDAADALAGERSTVVHWLQLKSPERR
jgi:MFS family permease